MPRRKRPAGPQGTLRSSSPRAMRAAPGRACAPRVIARKSRPIVLALKPSSGRPRSRSNVNSALSLMWYRPCSSGRPPWGAIALLLPLGPPHGKWRYCSSGPIDGFRSLYPSTGVRLAFSLCRPALLHHRARTFSISASAAPSTAGCFKSGLQRLDRGVGDPRRANGLWSAGHEPEAPPRGWCWIISHRHACTCPRVFAR